MRPNPEYITHIEQFLLRHPFCAPGVVCTLRIHLAVFANYRGQDVAVDNPLRRILEAPEPECVHCVDR